MSLTRAALSISLTIFAIPMPIGFSAYSLSLLLLYSFWSLLDLLDAFFSREFGKNI